MPLSHYDQPMVTQLHRTGFTAWIALVLLLVAGHASATVIVSPIPDISLGNWHPSVGNLNGTSGFCVHSTQGTGNTLRDYRVRVTPQSSAAFELISLVDTTQRIPIRVFFEDLLGQAEEELVVDAWSARENTAVNSCNPIQTNAQLRIEIAAADLGVVRAGFYQGSFRLRAGGSGQDSDTFVVTLSISEAVWIQNLDPIALAYNVGSDVSGNESFCVWSSTGAYDITISSITPTASTSFVARGQASSANVLSYSVGFDNDADASDGVGVVEGAVIPSQTTNASGNPPNCVVDNAALRVYFIESGNLETAPADIYQDELTLLIEPN
jgi:hypothetical protein